MHIARLNLPDVPQYRELMLHAFASSPDAFTTTAEERTSEPDDWWHERVADTSGRTLTLGAFDSGLLVGAVSIKFLTRHKIRHKSQLVGMFVHESFRNLGAGTNLVRAALSAARAQPGVRLMALSVTEGNTAAISLYERCGFHVFGIEPMAIAVAEGFKAKVHMWVSLEA